MKNEIKALDEDWQNIITMSPRSLYWCMIEEVKHTNRYCQQVLCNLTEQSQVYYVSSKKDDTCFNEMSQAKPLIKTLTYYELPAHTKAYEALAKELLKIVKSGKNHFIIIRTASEIWRTMPQTKLYKFLSDMIDFLAIEKSTLLIISEGRVDNKLEHNLSIYHSLLSGLSTIKQRYGKLYYMTLWWRVKHLEYLERSWPIAEKHTGFCLLPENQQKISGNIAYDELTVYAHKEVIDINERVTNQWQLFNSNALIAENARNFHSATVVFAFSDTINIYTLAKQVYETRIHSGDRLKIIVRKCNHFFRSTDMQILLNCGANMVLPLEIGFSAFLTMVSELKGLHYTRKLPKDINSFLNVTHLEEHKGYVSSSLFFRLVRQRVTMSLFASDEKGILITMLPKLGISPKQAALSCKLTRSGDIYTLSDDNLFLFLSMCGLSDADKVLSKIFPNTLKHLFVRYTVLSNETEIMDCLSNNEGLNHQISPLTYQSNSAPSADSPRNKAIINPSPQKISLNLGHIE